MKFKLCCPMLFVSLKVPFSLDIRNNLPFKVVNVLYASSCNFPLLINIFAYFGIAT